MSESFPVDDIIVLSHRVILFRKKILCRNVPFAENAENDGRRQAQPL
jgi:hypothetical protein